MAAPQNQSLIGNVLAQTQSHTWTRWSGRGLRCRSFLTFTGMFQHPVRSSHGVSSVQLLSHVRLFVIPWTAARQASLSFTISQSLLKLVSIESMMPSNHLILCSPLLLLPSVFPSVRVFSNESVLHISWPKHWSFSFNPSNEYSGLISFKIDWFDLLAVQGTLKSLLQHQGLKASVLSCSAFFIIQLLYSVHDYWKNHSFD